MTSTESDEVRLMRERRPNFSNKCELLQSMTNTRMERRAWIDEKHPTITDILRKYPRFQDIEEAVSTCLLHI